MNKQPLIEMVDLVKEFEISSGLFSGKKQVVHAVSNINLSINKGEIFALVGESGCGKSTLGRLALNLIEPTSGKVMFKGTDISSLCSKEMHKVRQKMQIVFQDPYASLNPRMNIHDIIAEPLVNYDVYKTKEEITARVRELMQKVGLRPESMTRHPYQFSGGQRQRIGIARALALDPEFIVCDEPISALDVSIQAQILNLLMDLQKELGLTYLFISHDLSVVRYLSDRVCVMFLGKVCESGATKDVYSNPQHPYTKFLLEAVPKPDPEHRSTAKFDIIGEIPSPVNPPSGCRFRTRCPYCQDICAEEEPKLKETAGRMVACHFAGIANK